MARRRVYRTSTRRPQWLVIATAVVSAVNAGIRLFKLFKKPGSRTTTSRPTPPEPRRQPAAPRVEPAPNHPAKSPAKPALVRSHGGIPDLFRQQRGDVVVTASGRIVKVLPEDLDDADGSERHQKFLVELDDAPDLTVRVCHNLKFGRVPLVEGQIVGFRGEYEYNDRGGTIHWTHHDPINLHEDGWIELDGTRYG